MNLLYLEMAIINLYYFPGVNAKLIPINISKSLLPDVAKFHGALKSRSFWNGRWKKAELSKGSLTGRRYFKVRAVLATAAMIYEANSDGTIFSLERGTSKQVPLVQRGELNADDWCRCWCACCTLRRANPDGRCQRERGVPPPHSFLNSGNAVEELVASVGAVHPHHLYVLIYSLKAKYCV